MYRHKRRNKPFFTQDMFTGIIRQLGRIARIDQKENLTELTIEAPGIAANAKKGDSIAVDGVCLTVTASGKTGNVSNETTQFTVQVIPETLARTIIGAYKENTAVNLETPMKLGDELHGHMVQGHVDFVGTVTAVKPDGDSTVLQISFPSDFAKFLALKGSVTVNGVSLTVSLLQEETLEVSLIPETLAATNLGALATDHKVNIEIDLIARYLDRLLQDKERQTTYQFLKERNII